MRQQENVRKTMRKLWLILISLLAISAVAAFLFYFRIMYYTKDDIRIDDITRINAETPDCIMLSMLPTEAFSAVDMAYFRGISAEKADHRFENLYDIKDFLDVVEESPNIAYLVVDPVFIASRYGYHASLYGKAYENKLLSVIRENTDTSYEILLSYYSLEYWRTLSEKKKKDVISAYRDFVNIFYGEPNVKIFFMGAEEWLIANPGNYETEKACNEAITRLLVAFTIRNDLYRLNPENMEKKFSMIRAMAVGKSTDPLLSDYDLTASVNLADTDIVFFGDSVIGNYTDSASIPGVVAGISGAKTYNFGIGGTTATFSLLEVVEAFLNRDFDNGGQAGRSMEAYYADHAARETDRNTYFIISFGLNDYFTGMPIDTPRSDDESSCYAGALRAAVKRLREEYPESRIILMTPNHSALFNGGMDINAPGGGRLSDYADAVFRVAKEMNVEVIDNYGGVGINADNLWTYITDGTHPNERGRYVIGRYILGNLIRQ